MAKMQARLDRVVKGVLSGGTSFVYWLPATVLDNNFNNWAHSHMGRALVAYYQASGRKEVLDALVKVYRQYPFPQVRCFAKGRKVSHITDIHSPYASVSHGPLLYALPSADETPNQERPGQAFNFALDGKSMQADRKAMPQYWSWPLDAPVHLTAPAVQFDWQPTDEQPLPEKPVEGGRPARITLVPYGCTKFRVSMFPVTRRTWEA